MKCFNDFRDHEVIDVYLQKSKRTFHKRKAIVERISPEKTMLGEVMRVTLLDKRNKPIRGNFFSTWFPIRKEELNNTKFSSIYLNESEVRENEMAVIKEVTTITQVKVL